MKNPGAKQIRSAEVVLPSGKLDETLAFFMDELGFRIDKIFPPDAPRLAVITGHGVRIRLDPEAAAGAGTLRLNCTAAINGQTLVAPNGTKIQIGSAEPVIAVPKGKQSFELARIAEASWHVGRAGMKYRSLLPSRQGGRFGASQIKIEEPGPVRDYVHYHEVRLQLIYCHKGEVRVVYEDQGEPFVLRPGDCVLQPPRIRHQVLESDGGLEVIEVTSPAEHHALTDTLLMLPSAQFHPHRDYSGQRFVRHVASESRWVPVGRGIDARDLGITTASSGLATALVVRVREGASVRIGPAPTEFLFRYLLRGTARLECEGQEPTEVVAGDAWHIPRGTRHALRSVSSDVEYLEVVLPGRRRGSGFAHHGAK